MFKRNFTRLLDALNNSKSSSSKIALILIIITGGFLRIYSATIGHGFQDTAIGDETLSYHYALSFLAGEPHALYLSQSEFNGGKLAGPTWAAFTAFLYKAGGESMQNGIVIMSLLNSLAIYLVYLLAIKFLNNRYALLSTLLFAVGPWPIYYASGLWNPLPLILLGGFLFLGLIKLSRERNSKSVFWLPLIVAVASQLHIIIIFYLPLIALYLFVLRQNINLKWLSLGIIAALTLYIPYIVGDSQNEWRNTAKYFSGKSSSSVSVIKAFTAPVVTLAASPGHLPFGDTERYKDFGNKAFYDYRIFFAIVIFSALLSLYLYYSFIILFLRKLFLSRKKLSLALSSDNHIFIGMTIAFPIFLFILSRHNYASRYAILIMPMIFLIPAYMTSEIMTGWKKNFILKSLLLLIPFNIWLSISFYNYQQNMIEQGDQFLASMTKLAKISHTIFSNRGTMSLAQIKLSETVNELSREEIDQFKIINNYINTEQKYIYSPTTDNPTVLRYTVHHIREFETLTNKPVYIDNAIIITRD